MNVAVIGGTGFIGRHIVCQLKNASVGVSVFGTADADLRLPVSQTVLANSIKDCDHAVILSALTPKKNLSRNEMLTRYLDNLRIMENICLALSASQVKRIIYVSTDAVYSADSQELHESAQTNPDNLYGLAHETRERLLQRIFSDKSVLIVRPCALFGSDDPHNGYGPNRFMREALQYKAINLFGQGEELRNHIFVEDFAKIICLLLESNITGVINVAPQPALSFYELAQQIIVAFPHPIELRFLSRQQPIIHKVHNTSRFCALMPHYEYTSLANALEFMYKDLVLPRELRSSINV